MTTRIPVLLLSGQNNHDWERSSVFCRDLLEATGRFDVTMSLDPSASLAGGAPLDYKLLFVDYNGPAWTEDAKQNFMAAVEGGVGVCILHAANNAFEGWTEYEKLCVLTWREDSTHGSYHPFDVRFVDTEHPITKGLPPVMSQHPDELYATLAHMHAAPYHLLATAYSSPESGGTGKDEPVLIVRTYGKGRVFHSILGHVWDGGPMDTFENADFQRILVRGCEWAATGNVADAEG